MTLTECMIITNQMSRAVKRRKLNFRY